MPPWKRATMRSGFSVDLMIGTHFLQDALLAQQKNGSTWEYAPSFPVPLRSFGSAAIVSLRHTLVDRRGNRVFAGVPRGKSLFQFHFVGFFGFGVLALVGSVHGSWRIVCLLVEIYCGFSGLGRGSSNP